MTPKSSRLAGMVAVAAALIILFARPIGDLARLSFSSDLYSYIPMVPLISVFLIWTGRRALPSGFIPAPRLALIPLSTGLLFLASYGWARSGGWKPELSDYLALMTVSLILLLASGCLFVLGKATLRAIAFPAAFLFLAAPIPSQLHAWIEQFLQHASADTAHLLFWMSGTAVFRQGLVFQLPGFIFEVAPEYRGIPAGSRFPIARIHLRGRSRMQRHPFHARAFHHRLAGGAFVPAHSLEARAARGGRDTCGAVQKRRTNLHHRAALRPLRPGYDRLVYPPARRPDLFCFVACPVLHLPGNPPEIGVSPGCGRWDARCFFSRTLPMIAMRPDRKWDARCFFSRTLPMIAMR